MLLKRRSFLALLAAAVPGVALLRQAPPAVAQAPVKRPGRGLLLCKR